MLLDFESVIKTARCAPKKEAKKLGTVKINIVEATPVVWKDRLLRFEWLRPNTWGLAGQMATGQVLSINGNYHFVDAFTEEEVGVQFAEGYAFGCCYSENGKMYAFGPDTAGGHNLDTFVSEDLVNWEKFEGIKFPENINLYNTSVCKADGKYVMAIEIGGKHEAVGVPFTCVFAESEDLIHWNLLDIMEYSYNREYYSACPCIRFYGGYYYMIYLEGAPHHRWFPYIVRTKDLKNWELGTTNPIMLPSKEDKIFYDESRFNDKEKDYLLNAVDCNNSDYDLAEFGGKTYIIYSWGNQFGKEFLAMAEYEGSEEEYLTSFFN